jgi:hypothetical protein
LGKDSVSYYAIHSSWRRCLSGIEPRAIGHGSGRIDQWSANGWTVLQEVQRSNSHQSSKHLLLFRPDPLAGANNSLQSMARSLVFTFE